MAAESVDMMLKIDGIQGESRKDGHQNEIDVQSWDWGAKQSGTTHLGMGGGSGKVQVADMTFTKFVDKSSPNLFQYCCTGKHIPQVVLCVRKAGGTPLEYLKITMKQVIISSYTMDGESDKDRIGETVTMNFANVKMEYVPQSDTGSAQGSVQAGFDIAQNKAA